MRPRDGGRRRGVRGRDGARRAVRRSRSGSSLGRRGAGPHGIGAPGRAGARPARGALASRPSRGLGRRDRVACSLQRGCTASTCTGPAASGPAAPFADDAPAPPASAGSGGRPRRRPRRRACATRPIRGPGSRRRRAGRGFSYRTADGEHDPRPRRPAPDQGAGRPAGLDGRLDLPATRRPPAGDRARRARAQAVPLPRPLARAAR